MAFAAIAHDTDIKPSFVITEDNHVNVSVGINLLGIPVKSNQTVVYTPYLSNGTDSLELAHIAVLGRRNYIQYQRGNLDRTVPPEAVVFKESETPESYIYSSSLEFLPWFDGATLAVKAIKYGCAGCKVGVENFDSVEVYKPIKFEPSQWTHYVQPKAEGVKIRNVNGRANVEFPVNKTILLSDFRNNYAELDTIRKTIDVVRNDSNCNIKTMAIRGFASPEGSYANNTRLAKGRTEALCHFVEQLYNLPTGFINASYEPEDWDGLQTQVMNLNLSHKDEILAIISDTLLDPDVRDNRIKKLYPEEYKFLLEHIYPGLRHSDYRIDYEVRSFSNPEEILKVMHANPKNLSLEEFFIAAQSLEPATPAFNEVFEVAARLFPHSKEANLNAGINAMNNGEYELADKYLSQAGDSFDAIYSRAILAIATENYEEARQMLELPECKGNEQAMPLLNELDRIQNHK